MLFFVEASSEICKASKERVRTCKDYIIGRKITTLLKITVDNVILEFFDYFVTTLLVVYSCKKEK